jgi:hypothetical protein
MDFDNLLYRSLSPGTEYNNLIPKPKYNKVLIGEGNTDYSIKEMAELVEESSHECQLLAQKLQASSLKDCIANVKDFAYNNFQYHADDADQMLRTLAYSWWVDKVTGIDCKSYSIIVSSLLTEMGINHYIRKIKQPGFAPTEYTHVYVVVPMDQQTNLLQNGYYIVDGTLKRDLEPAFIGTKDKFMAGLQHYKLNGAANVATLDNLNKIVTISSKMQPFLDKIKGFFNSIGCIGGTWYNDGVRSSTNSKITEFVALKIKNINKGVIQTSWNDVAKEIQELRGVIYSAHQGFHEKRTYTGYNHCTYANLDSTIALLDFYYDIVAEETLQIWLDKYFDYNVTTETASYNCNSFENNLGFIGCYLNDGGGYDSHEPLMNISPKQSTNIPAFEVTDYVTTIQSPNDISPEKFLSTLSNVLIIAKSVADSGSDAESGVDFTNPNSTNSNNVNMASLGWFAGIAIVLIGYSLATSKKELIPNNKKSK